MAVQWDVDSHWGIFVQAPTSLALVHAVSSVCSHVTIRSQAWSGPEELCWKHPDTQVCGRLHAVAGPRPMQGQSGREPAACLEEQVQMRGALPPGEVEVTSVALVTPGDVRDPFCGPHHTEGCSGF